MGRCVGVFRAAAVMLAVFSLAAMPADAAQSKSAKKTAKPAAAKVYNPKYTSIIVEADTGRVLYQSAADDRAPPASLTKMMTLYMLFDAIGRGEVNLSTPMKVSQHAAAQAPSKLDLRVGTTITADDAINALITRSANDVAAVVAEHLGGTEAKFAAMMTNKSRTIGMSRTVFRNASGLPAKGQVSTARDMAVLAKRLMVDFPQHYKLFSRKEFLYAGRVYRTHNNLLNNYEGTDGIKTGFTNASGFNLVASAQRNGKRVIGVVFGGRSAAARDKHLAQLMDGGFAMLNGNPEVLMAAPRIDFDAPVQMAAADESIAAGDVDDAAAVPSVPKLLGISSANATELAALPAGAHWGVQIGAFGTYERADARAAAGLAKVQSSYSAAQARVESVVVKGRKLYRAQIVGLPERDLIRACGIMGAKLTSDCKKVGPVVQ